MSTPSPVTGYILAGGLSRRLGRDKAALPWRGTTLLEYMTEILSTVSSTVQIIGRGAFPDLVPGIGPIGGILTALHSSTTEANLIIAVDLPLLTSDFLKYFNERCRQTDRLVTACKIESSFPVCLGVRASLKPVVDDYVAAGKRSLHGLIESCNPEIVSSRDLAEAGFAASLFTNINTEADYQSALRL